MADYASLAQALTSLLGLAHPPIAIATASAVPEGVPLFKGISPSSCSFWVSAEKEVFAVPDLDHMNCPVGAMVMGFNLTAQAQAALNGGLELMCSVGYIKPEEAQHIPSLEKKAPVVIYGPLAGFPVSPQIVLLWIQPSQAMLLREATREAEWKSDIASTVFGRPACAALAVASNTGSVALSFGCSGMRTFTGVEPSLMLAALPGPLLASLEESLTKAFQANCSMQSFYDKQKTYFPFQKKGSG